MLHVVHSRSEVTTVKQKQAEPKLCEQLACGFTVLLGLVSSGWTVNHPVKLFTQMGTCSLTWVNTSSTGGLHIITGFSINNENLVSHICVAVTEGQRGSAELSL